MVRFGEETARRSYFVERHATHKPKWYVCYTRARHEKLVARLLGARGFDAFLPLSPRRRQWKDRVTTVPWPLFPCYIFVRFELPELHRVLATPGLTSVVKIDGRPAPVREEELDNVRRFAEGLSRFEGPEPERIAYPERGDYVRIVEGPLEGVEGIVLETRGRKRIVVGLKVIGQGLLVQVQAKTVRKVSRRRSRQRV